ncbi:hypothetical protein CEE37_12985 [candidate division LCP-89 bacterium B3_LCP]|uniref:Uncharacterized protein n=1 Tax=candidate division LCP-89 bacterium B3_LCP TaxID=2012998 RepID=A0A532UUH8_UNCL8|nr:MAG: hypothetical protein CEE37_12985 [candidate division LCP-89 bacterium B3_LCP]
MKRNNPFQITITAAVILLFIFVSAPQTQGATPVKSSVDQSIWTTITDNPAQMFGGILSVILNGSFGFTPPILEGGTGLGTQPSIPLDGGDNGCIKVENPGHPGPQVPNIRSEIRHNG